MTPRDAKAEMKKHTNTRYDGEILSFLLADDDVSTSKYIYNTMKASQLKAGMVLAKNLYNDSHILILPEGHIFTDATIQKLTQFEEERRRAFSILIEPDTPLDETEEGAAPQDT